MDIGTIGIWSGHFRSHSDGENREHAAILDDLGFHTLWIPGGGSEGILSAVRSCLESTTSLVVASGILSIWLYPAADVVRVFGEIQEASGDRAVLGLGVSHAPTVNANNTHTYAQPLRQMITYLDELDAAGLATDDRILAALGPKMLDLARSRSAGAHPYCVTVEHTKIARERLGVGPLLAPEVKVIMESDPIKARAAARANLARYLKLDNYVSNLLRLGWTAEEIDNDGSDRLIDALVGWGTKDQIAAHIHSHLAAGADHVAIQVITATPNEFPVPEWESLSELVADLL